MYHVKGKATPRNLDRRLFLGLLQLWREQNAEYAALCARFKENQKESRRNGKQHLCVTNIADWHDARPLLTPTELNWIAMQPAVKVYIYII